MFVWACRIANTMQYMAHDSYGRNKNGVETQVALGLLPFSHIYGLVVIAHGSFYRGDEVIVLPKFEMPTFLSAIDKFRINQMFLVSCPWGPQVKSQGGCG